MEETAQHLAKAAAEAAQLEPREKFSQKGRHQRNTEAYERASSAKGNELAEFILKQYADEIAAVTRHIGFLLRKLKKLTIVEIERGYLTTGPLELGLALPLTAEAEIVLEATPRAIPLTQAQEAALNDGEEVLLPVALKKDIPVVLKAQGPMRMEGINFIPPRSDFCVEPPGVLALLFLFEVHHRPEGDEVGNR